MEWARGPIGVVRAGCLAALVVLAAFHKHLEDSKPTKGSVEAVDDDYSNFRP
jgi:hypothetical protein